MAPKENFPRVRIPLTGKWIKGLTALVFTCALNSFLTAMGNEDTSSASAYLTQAISTHDQSQILQAFSHLYWSRLWPMSAVTPPFKAALNAPEPFVRYHAAESLFRIGDQSGAETLLKFVTSPTPIMADQYDMRIDAGCLLAKYAKKDATQPIYKLYQETKNGQLIGALLILAPDQASTLVPPKGYYAATLALQDYAIGNDRQYLPDITSTFNNTQKLDVKAAAAWALATMTNDQSAIDYLVQKSQEGLADPESVDGVAERDITKYLGTIQTPEAKQALESALASKDPTVVQIAIVNLLYNQSGSDKAIQTLATQLADSPHATLPWDFTFSVSAQFLSNPLIQSAGQVFERHDATRDWYTYTVERRNWSIYNWLGDYVLKLNR